MFDEESDPGFAAVFIIIAITLLIAVWLHHKGVMDSKQDFVENQQKAGLNYQKLGGH